MKVCEKKSIFRTKEGGTELRVPGECNFRAVDYFERAAATRRMLVHGKKILKGREKLTDRPRKSRVSG